MANDPRLDAGHQPLVWQSRSHGEPRVHRRNHCYLLPNAGHTRRTSQGDGRRRVARTKTNGILPQMGGLPAAKDASLLSRMSGTMVAFI